MSTPPFVTLPRGVTQISLDGGFDRLSGLIAHPAESPRGLVLLVPGFTGSKEDFIAIIPILRDLGYLVVSFDQRGQYQSPGPDDLSSYSLGELGADVLTVIEQVRPNDQLPVHLIGHSFAGLVARQVIIDSYREGTNPGITSLMLLSTGPGPVPGELQDLCRQLIDHLPQTPLEQIWAIKEAVDEGDSRVPASQSVHEFLRNRFVSNNPYGLAAMARILIEVPNQVSELRIAVDALRIRTLVCFGANDDRWTPAEQIQMAQELNTPHAIFDNLAHSPAAEDPLTCVTAFEAFFTDSVSTFARSPEFDANHPGYTLGMELSTPVIADPAAVSGARKTLLRQLQAWGLDHLADDLQLIASELITNAVRYGKAPINVRLHTRGSRVRVEVTDGNPNDVPEQLDAGSSLTHGRGIPLIEAIASSWGVDHHSNSKTVWAELKIA